MNATTHAEAILLSLGITSPREINLEAIAWTRGAVINYRPLQRCEATIVGSQRRAVISVNSQSCPERQRFSIGHELGHWHHHKGQLLFCSGRDIENCAYDPLNPERHADEFASDLLLPNYMLLPKLRKIRRPTLAATRELAGEFCASQTAMLLKITLSNQFPMMIVCHDTTGRRWFRGAPSVQRWWFPRKDLDRETFAAGILFEGASEQRLPNKVPAEAWFDFNGCDRFEVDEQSFMLPNREVLTVLRLPDEALG
ncbi:ImmA/IrrE family metallo-endopeptidase [Methylovirgula sp. HY1]|uniref:ImmA/IrrE family metallo-endopeptidase n=1 Tax=Methylovirgula sp. HY1 TaxID=2822761 RepID=UPI001C5BA54A|nr:ImmA/IrrE family metallo-endopeptidase [Methylovirgula sp. HY1]QXX76129.1 hypothetical protein MHY1_02964 [Methylovirgula sp. HY1]